MSIRLIRSIGSVRSLLGGLAVLAAVQVTPVHAVTEADYDAAYEDMLNNPEDLQAIVNFVCNFK